MIKQQYNEENSRSRTNRQICSHVCVVLLSVSLNESLHIDKQTRHSRPASLPQTVCALVRLQHLQVSIFASCGPTLKQHPFSAISAQTCSPVLVLAINKSNTIQTQIQTNTKQTLNKPEYKSKTHTNNTTLHIEANRLNANKLDANKLDANKHNYANRLAANEYETLSTQ